MALYKYVYDYDNYDYDYDVYHSGCRDKHNCSPWDSIPGSQTSLLGMLALDQQSTLTYLLFSDLKSFHVVADHLEFFLQLSDLPTDTVSHTANQLSFPVSRSKRSVVLRPVHIDATVAAMLTCQALDAHQVRLRLVVILPRCMTISSSVPMSCSHRTWGPN